jgi:hypothetical protein
MVADRGQRMTDRDRVVHNKDVGAISVQKTAPPVFQPTLTRCRFRCVFLFGRKRLLVDRPKQVVIYEYNNVPS